MSDYAKAINVALGLPEETPAPSKSVVKRMVAQAGTEGSVMVARNRHQDLGILHFEDYKGWTFVVREKGVISFGSTPGAPCDHWHVYCTDEELVNENLAGGGEFQQRIQTCRNAIDRMLKGTVIWTGKWYERPLFI